MLFPSVWGVPLSDVEDEKWLRSKYDLHRTTYKYYNVENYIYFHIIYTHTHYIYMKRKLIHNPQQRKLCSTKAIQL